MLFHGSPKAGFSDFDLSKIDSWHPGFFFTDDLPTALSYTPGGKFDPFDAEKGVYRVYVKMENPLVVDAQGFEWHSIPFNGQEVKTDDIGHYAKEQGYDGAIIRNVVDVGNYADEDDDDLDFGPQTIYIVFDPRNIKSAVYNRGTWDPSDVDMRKNPRRPRLRRLRR
jgi:hypothetical protein